MSRGRYRLFALFLLVSACFGGTFVAAKVGLAYLPPLLFVALRFDIGAAVLGAYVVARYPRERWLPRTRADVAGILAAGVFAVGLTNALLFVGQRDVTSGVGAIVYSLNPILTPAFAAVLLSDERLSRGKAAGMLLGFVGVGMVVGADPASLLGGGVVAKATILAAAASGALGSVLIRRADASLPVVVRTAWAVAVAALLCHLLSLGAGERVAAVTPAPAALAALGYVGVFSTAVAFVAYFRLLDGAGAIRGNLVFYVVPVVATLGGWALLGESVSASTLAGFLTIAAGFAVVGHEPIGAELSRLRAAIDRRTEADLTH